MTLYRIPSPLSSVGTSGAMGIIAIDPVDAHGRLARVIVRHVSGSASSYRATVTVDPTGSDPLLMVVGYDNRPNGTTIDDDNAGGGFAHGLGNFAVVEVGLDGLRYTVHPKLYVFVVPSDGANNVFDAAVYMGAQT